MQAFDVLSSQQQVSGNLFLEASAGTGKTFSIEHLFVRHLLEGVAVHEILVITFTRAVARELRHRIRQSIRIARQYLGEGKQEPSYLRAYTGCTEAMDRLYQAERFFDEAQIYTIHAFCAQILKDHSLQGELQPAFSLLQPFETDSASRMRRLESVMYRTLQKLSFSDTQLQILLSSFQNDWTQLVRAVYPLAEKNLQAQRSSPMDFKQLWYAESAAFKEEMVVAAEEDLLLQIQHFKGVCNRAGELKLEVQEHLQKFLEAIGDSSMKSWESLCLHGSKIFSWIQPSNAKKSFQSFHSRFATWFQSKGGGYLSAYLCPDRLFAYFASAVSSVFHEEANQARENAPNDLLEQAYQASRNEGFCEQVAKRYKVAIVDEFQDTDPLQWQILHALFRQENTRQTRLVLVGDPKQSIYSFRESDLSVYLQAKASFEKKEVFHLSTNFRSSKSLVEGLNILFSEKWSPDLFHLGKEGKLENPSLIGAKELAPIDSRHASIHFLSLQDHAKRSQKLPSEECLETGLLPYLCTEIHTLTRDGNLKPDDIAILVKDRYQGEVVQKGLAKQGIAAITRRRQDLSKSQAFRAMLELLQVLANPRDMNTFRVFCGSSLLRMEMHELVEESPAWQKAYNLFLRLYAQLDKKSFSWFCSELLHQSWDGKESSAERLLQVEEGAAFLREWAQIVEVSTPHFDREKDPLRLRLFLEELPLYARGDDERGLIRQAHDQSAVHILSLHMSKGLEFPVVFSVATATRSRAPSRLLTYREQEVAYLSLAKEGDQKLIEHTENLEAEKIRQLYVAWTRASLRLYIPWIVPRGSAEKPKWGESAPMELYLAQFGRSFTSFPELYTQVSPKNYEAFQQVLAQHPSLSFEKVEDSFCSSIARQKKERASSLSPPPPSREVRSKWSWSSFSRLQRGETSMVIEDVPHDWMAENKTAFTLPAGAETGILLHQLLEKAPLHQPDSWLSNLEHSLRLDRYKSWTSVIQQMLTLAIGSPLFIDGPAAQDLDPRAVWRELPFSFTQSKREVLTGVTDLIFLHRGKLYLLDWKTHYLGQEIESYHEQRLKQFVVEKDYLRQVKLYAEACRRYMREIKAPWSLGGAIFIFLRGLATEENSGRLFLSNKELLDDC